MAGRDGQVSDDPHRRRFMAWGEFPITSAHVIKIKNADHNVLVVTACLFIDDTSSKTLCRACTSKFNDLHPADGSRTRNSAAQCVIERFHNLVPSTESL